MAISSPTPSLISPVSPTPSADLLLVDASPEAAGYAAVLRGSYRVATTTSTEIAKQFLHRHSPTLVVTELGVAGLDGVEICREAKSLMQPPPVLVTTTDAERVPDALAVGCDGVLLKPFAPNLLFARIGRLLRARGERLRAHARHQQLRSAHLSDRSEALLAGTNRIWPNTHCPYCNHGGVTSFEFCSHRRAWYACLECRKVWIAKRQE
jgi:DNA-binding response OmpR family regulator